MLFYLDLPYRALLGCEMVGDYAHADSDIAATNGSVPRSVHPIATASYPMDKHQHQRLAVQLADGLWA